MRLLVAAATAWAALAGVARADDPERALWAVHGLPAADEAALRSAVAASTGLSLVDPPRVVAALERAAAEIGDDPTAPRVAALLSRARRAYVELRLGEASEAYGEALETMLGSERAVADARAAAVIHFELALVAMAAQRGSDAEGGLVSALVLDPALAPDRSIYGEPVFAALRRARQRARRIGRASLLLSVEPADATVHIDGRAVDPSAPIPIAAGVAHLVTASSPGHVPRSLFVLAAARGTTRHDVVLPPARGALLALHALDRWRAAGGGEPAPEALRDEVAALVLDAAGLDHVVTATAADGEIALALLSADSGETLRTAQGGRLTWEERPYHVLAEALAGRVVTPPFPSDEERVALSVVAPAEVRPGEPFSLRVTLRDPGALARSLRASCGAARAQSSIAAAGSLALVLTAPDREGDVACRVTALGAEGELLAALPARGEELSVAVVEAERGRSRWWIWTTVAAAVIAGAAVAAFAVARDRPQVLLIDVPQ